MKNFTQIVELVMEESFIHPHPNLKQLLNNVVLPKGENKYFKLVWVDTEKFDALFKQDGEFYIGKGGVGRIGDRYNRFIEFLDTGEEKGFFPIQSPLVHLSFMDGRWKIMFTNGRHRYAVFRDMGAKAIPVGFDKSNLADAMKLGLIVKN